MPGNSPSEGGMEPPVLAAARPDSPSSSPATSPVPAASPKMESQRRLSTSSDASSSGLNDSQKLDANMDYIPTRMTKVSTPKPAANPLQFVKVGPCDLFKSAQETLKKVEEVKKMKREVRDEAEEWQSNLDNWKCSRRKRVEHIIDRVVEVKKFELEEHERNRRKAKTFSEMMEERTSRGRKMSLLVHKDDDSNDLSDLGIGTSSDKSSVSEDYANDDNHSMDDGDVSLKNHYHDQSDDHKQNGNGDKTTTNGHDDETSTCATISSPEPEEYTYDRAIQGYMNFTETRVKSRSVTHVSQSETEIVEDRPVKTSVKVTPQKRSSAAVPKPRKDSINVEEDIADMERLQSRKFSGSSGDLQTPEKKLNVPKVDIHKRKELFERSESHESNEQFKIAPRAAGDFANSKSIRDRMSHLGKQKNEEIVEKPKHAKQLSAEVSVKDRLSLLERQKSTDSQIKSTSSSKLNTLVSSGDGSVTAPPSIKDRLSCLEQVSSQDRSSKISSEITPTSIKERLSELEAPREIPKKVTPDRDPTFRDKLANFRSTEADLNSTEVTKSMNNSVVDSSARYVNPDDEEFYRKRSFHRSLDSLDVDSSSVVSNEPYERVQSLEDLDSCGPSRNYPASASSNENLVLSSHSGDTDREDSGIHTADVSCSVSQADEPADLGDINVPCSNMHLENENSGSYGAENDQNMEYAPPTIVSQLAKINLTEADPLENGSNHPEVGSKAYCMNSRDAFIERDLSSVTSGETDADVSSFLDQALLEEDMKMSAPLTQPPAVAKHEAKSNDASVLSLQLSFPLDTPTSAEPPKEKPPPPPVELSDEEENADQKKNNAPSLRNSNAKSNLGRLDSTKRIKKDMRRKRSDFLGIEGSNDSYLDCELKVAPPPDMTSFLQEERRLEQELYRQMQPTLYPESDHGSNQGESRDSGVELDNHLHSHNPHTDYSHEVQSSENHSRQNSETFGNASSTSEEDEIIKKEREIIEMLEKEEQWRYGTNTILSPSDHHQVGEKLAAKLRELEQEKMRLEWERAEESRKVAAEQAVRQEDQRRIRLKEQHLRQQESRHAGGAGAPFDCDPSDMTPEALREERERLKQEQAELNRQRELFAANQANNRQSWDSSSSTAHRSLQDVSGSPLIGNHSQLNVPINNAPLNYRLSLPDLQQSDLAVQPMATHHHRPPPPIPPAKPLSVISQERHSSNGLSRQEHLQSSADSLSLSSESQHSRFNSVGLPSVPMAVSPTSSTGSQQMTRQTLHALSAAPRSKIIATDTWVQAKRKPESQRNNNRDHYQHWLIQEAEQRRITEQHQRNAVSRKSLPPNVPQSQHVPAITPVQPQTAQGWQYPHAHHQHIHQVPHQHQHPHQPHPHPHMQHSHVPAQTSTPPVPPPPRQEKPLPDAIIQTLTQRVQNRASMNDTNRRLDNSPAWESRSANQIASNNINNNNMSNLNISHSHTNGSYAANSQEKMLSVSGKKKCSHCNEELGRGAAMIIESLRLFYHMDCFKCCVCHVQLGDGLMGTDVRVRNHKLHCHNCYSSDDGVKFSCV